MMHGDLANPPSSSNFSPVKL
uniref:Uncharacterized protein n=1 Tax=Rhizophora mucronata TaxID=61149 RepID=A0A2P2R1G6_RHIMU